MADADAYIFVICHSSFVICHSFTPHLPLLPDVPWHVSTTPAFPLISCAKSAIACIS
ncbi:hypothetical protein [Coleofasciculus sp. F4-SAH-05]|uniref:hypothetical protein n=1 Tax=Coleofasciculus sp. F4-SAH-05 TaxID=3069525 RepID=UPI0032F0E8A0